MTSAKPTQPLSAIWARRAELSGHASTHVRTSALAGIAISWLFAGGSDGTLADLETAPRGLVFAAAFFAASLAADILQYYVGAAVFRGLARHFEKQGKANDDPVGVPLWAPRVPAVFYNLKVWLLLVGYVSLAIVFVKAL